MSLAKTLSKLSVCFLVFSTVSCATTQKATVSSNLDKQSVYQAMTKVTDWQMAKFNNKTYLFEGYDKGAHMAPTDESSHPQGWVYASYYVGMARMAELASSKGNDKYYEQLLDIAKHGKYLFAPRIYNADDYAIGQLYLDLYKKYPNEEMLTPLKVIFEIILQTPSTTTLTYEDVTQTSVHDGKLLQDEFGNRKFQLRPCKNRWCWADALFMGPPVWINLSKVTGDSRYLEFADKELWETVNLLWDDKDHLFFRDSRFFDKREANGEKVIWARGVGWVAAGLARILEHFPEEHPSRAKYEDIFRKMMTRLAQAQQPDGLWRPSVLDPKTQPFKETSGTGLMAFAFASGINQGILDKKTFMPVVTKAWSALVDAVQPSGKLGWVQQIGDSPDNVSAEDTQIYATGAFLLTGSELYKLSK
ncbi:glycoside hydrolase family 88 protein [Colwellia sp. UCD-KL20]|uniref:glycoside hydrolase family 88/105 protein n=1 Tax=Colwellia sp. UCD-KL20 TaxID=1917165 RepID=UPI0009F84F64|nr:glycoside hydrolase family 88 protein [Colwellia sp. UCD-KL20]